MCADQTCSQCYGPGYDDESQQRPVAEARIKRWRMSEGQSRIDDTGFSGAEPRDEITVCVDDRGDPCVCGPDDGKPFLDGAHACRGEVLLRPDAGSEPGIVGRVEDPVRPDWIFNATNDAWFGTSIGPEQHLASARMRAVEEGLPVVRAANTGISAIIDANGDLVARLGTGETGVIDAALPFAHPPTLYARFGDWTLLALIIVTWAVALAAGLVGTHRDNKKTRTEAKSCW